MARILPSALHTYAQAMLYALLSYGYPCFSNFPLLAGALQADLYSNYQAS